MSMHCFTAIVVKIRVASEQKSSLKRQFSVRYQHKYTIFPLNLHWTELQFSAFCCDNGTPDGRDVQAGLTDRMIYQRHVCGFLVFPVGGVRLNSCRWFMLCLVYISYPVLALLSRALSIGPN
jgi:hypothetical protein